MKVSEDEALFASYFWWRKFYRARPCSEQHEMGVACHRETFTTAYCQLCARLHHQPPQHQILSHVKTCWTEAQCDEI